MTIYDMDGVKLRKDADVIIKNCSCEICGCNEEFKVMCLKHCEEMYKDITSQFKD